MQHLSALLLMCVQRLTHVQCYVHSCQSHKLTQSVTPDSFVLELSQPYFVTQRSGCLFWQELLNQKVCCIDSSDT